MQWSPRCLAGGGMGCERTGPSDLLDTVSLQPTGGSMCSTTFVGFQQVRHAEASAEPHWLSGRA